MTPYTTTFPNNIGHGKTLGRPFRTLAVPTKILWGPGFQIYHWFLEWTGLYIHSDKKSLRNPQIQHPSNFWDKTLNFSKNTKAEMTALARYIDLKPPWTISVDKSNKIQGLGTKSSFHHPSLFLSLICGCLRFQKQVIATLIHSFLQLLDISSKKGSELLPTKWYHIMQTQK